MADYKKSPVLPQKDGALFVPKLVEEGLVEDQLRVLALGVAHDG
jgi:hypothetical protein